MPGYCACRCKMCKAPARCPASTSCTSATTRRKSYAEAMAKGALQMPQCRAHDQQSEQGCAGLVNGVAARGTRHAVHQWPIQSEATRGRQCAKRERHGMQRGRGKRYAAGADMHMHVVTSRRGRSRWVQRLSEQVTPESVRAPTSNLGELCRVMKISSPH